MSFLPKSPKVGGKVGKIGLGSFNLLSRQSNLLVTTCTMWANSHPVNLLLTSLDKLVQSWQSRFKLQTTTWLQSTGLFKTGRKRKRATTVTCDSIITHSRWIVYPSLYPLLCLPFRKLGVFWANYCKKHPILANFYAVIMVIENGILVGGK